MIGWFGLAAGVSRPEVGAGEFLTHLSRVKRAGGACETTADCVSGNVCSKWGWCQWTSIYGADGPSQGAAAPGGGRAGQCVTSADCGSRVPYCSKLGYCHGGRLPFDEAQLEVPQEDKTGDNQPQGFINNNPRKNNPAVKSSKGKPSKSASTRKTSTNTRKSKPNASSRSKPATSAGRSKLSSNRHGQNGGGQRASTSSKGQGAQAAGRRSSNSESGGSASACPGGTLEKCVEACIPIKQIRAYGACTKQCGKRC